MVFTYLLSICSAISLHQALTASVAGPVPHVGPGPAGLLMDLFKQARQTEQSVFLIYVATCLVRIE